MGRKAIPDKIQADVLVATRRRCALCFGLDKDDSRKQGQIAHIDRDRENHARTNLTFLCLPHHDEYDTTGTSQSKAMRPTELVFYVEELRQHLESRLWATPTVLGELEIGVGCSSDVFEVRIESYRVIRDFVLRILTEANVTREEIQAFGAATSERLFLFGPDVETFAREVVGRAIRLRSVQRKLERLRETEAAENERESLLNEDVEILEWFDETYRSLGSRFYPYLHLKSV